MITVYAGEVRLAGTPLTPSPSARPAG